MFLDIYGAKVNASGQWEITNYAFNTTGNEGGQRLSGSIIVATVYGSGTDASDIYLAERLDSENSWGPATRWEHSTLCLDDNPEIYSNGTKMIFESTRGSATGSGAPCANTDSGDIKLWYSEKSGSSWSTPVLLTGAPNNDARNHHAWIDETTGELYWTASIGIKKVSPGSGSSGVSWASTADTVITPTALNSSDPQAAAGKVVFVGDYSHATNVSVFGCGIVDSASTTSDSSLYLDHWSINIHVCAVKH